MSAGDKGGDQPRGSACWGAHFSSGACPPHFIPGKLHFKNKFCEICRACLPMPLTHVRALSREQVSHPRASIHQKIISKDS